MVAIVIAETPPAVRNSRVIAAAVAARSRRDENENREDKELTPMPTYEYETIPQTDSERPMQFEIWQRMAEEPLTAHPETGQPVRRIISGGLSSISKKSACCASKCDCG